MQEGAHEALALLRGADRQHFARGAKRLDQGVGHGVDVPGAVRASCRLRKLRFEPLTLAFEPDERCTDAWDFLLAGCREIDQAIDSPSSLGDPCLQGLDVALLRSVSREQRLQALPQDVPVKDALEPLLNAVKDGLVEIGHGHAEPVADAESRRYISAAHVVRVLGPAHGLMRLELLAAVSTRDQRTEQVRAVPRPAYAEAARLMFGLSSLPELRRDDFGERLVDNDTVRHGALDLTAPFADLCIARLGVDEPPTVDRVAEDRPDRVFRPRGGSAAASGGGRGHPAVIEAMGDGGQAPTLLHVRGEDFSNDRGLDRLDHEGDALALRLPAPGLEDVHGASGLAGSPPIAVGWGATGPVPAFGVRAKPARDHLREFLRVVVGEDPLEALHEVPGQPRIIGARFMRVHHAHARAPEGVFVKSGFLGVEAREAADVIAQDDIGGAKGWLGADLQEGEKLVATRGVEAARIIGELAHDPIAVCGCPRADGLPLLFDGQVLICPRTAVRLHILLWGAKRGA